MKILILTSIYPDEYGFLGGIFIHNQAVALRKAGYDVAVMYLDFRSLRKKRPIGKSKYELDGVLVYRYSFPCGPFYSLIQKVSRNITLKEYKYIQKEIGSPDLIYVHFGCAAVYAKYIKEVYGIPYVIIEHDSGVLTESIEEKQLKVQSSAYNDASAVIAVSNALKEKLQKLTWNSVMIVHNIVPEYMFDNSRTRDKDGNFIFVSVGNLIKSKAFDFTIRVFSDIVKENKNVKLLIVGTGCEKQNLKQLVSDIRLKEKVKFLGKVDNKDIPKLLSICDCFVLPSRFETFGVSYIEAMACGLPVIATRCGGPEDFVNKENGILIDIDNECELKAAMKRMITDRDSYDSKKIRKYAYDISSESVVVHQLNEIFKDYCVKL